MTLPVTAILVLRDSTAFSTFVVPFRPEVTLMTASAEASEFRRGIGNVCIIIRVTCVAPYIPKVVTRVVGTGVVRKLTGPPPASAINV